MRYIYIVPMEMALQAFFMMLMEKFVEQLVQAAY